MTDKKTNGISRRDLILNASAGIAAASLLGTSLASATGIRAAQDRPRPRGSVNTGHNILFVFVDQERHLSRWPRGLDLPGHERLVRTGTYLKRHHISATMCTSSRSIMLTGLQTADNGMSESSGTRWAAIRSTTSSPAAPSRGCDVWAAP